MFTTRAVIVTQKLDDNKEQTCLIALADFQSIERKELFKYSKPPSTKYKGPYEVLGLTARNEWLLKEGRISPEMATMHTNFFDLWTRMFKIRPCDEGIFAQTLSGLIKDVPTTQEALPLTDRISADWWRCRTPLTDPAEHISTLAFLMSGGLDIVPLMHQRKFLDESGPCFALDFSLRVFSNEIDATEWHLREWKTIAAGAGRTYSEAQLWDERGDMVATMTQASILRPKSAGRSRL
ncbi:Hypothetical protein D9617_36g063110 [Elsinoe fawcettii]|nr:Hypothetical protein D9617_36g063110 [Elsinoe fawcettii]